MDVSGWRPVPGRAMPALAAATLLALAGCSAGAQAVRDPDGGTSRRPAAQAPPAAPAVEVVMTVRAGTVRPAAHQLDVRRGQTVRLVVASDVADQVHVHGFDIAKDVTPPHRTVLEFVADAPPGVVEVELERSSLRLVQLRLH